MCVRFTWQVWGKVAIGGVANVVSRGRRGEACTQRAFRVAGVGNGATGGLTGHRFCVARTGNRARQLKQLEILREFGCAGVCSRVRRCEIVAGTSNPWTCGCKLGADVSWNAVAGCGDWRRVCRVCGAVPWNAVAGCGDWRRACRVWRRVLRIADQARVWVAPCLWDCWLIGIADQGVVWVAPCH